MTRRFQNFINGRSIPPNSNDWIDSVNPATGEVIAQIPKSGSLEVENSVVAADSARKSWSDLSLEKRTIWLDKIADVLESKSEEIASLEAFLMGGYGEIYRMGAPLNHPQVLVAESAVAGGHYTLCTFNFKDSRVTGSFTEEVSPKSMIVACPTDCGPFAVTATAHSLGKLLTSLTGVTITWTT